MTAERQDDIVGAPESPLSGYCACPALSPRPQLPSGRSSALSAPRRRCGRQPQVLS